MEFEACSPNELTLFLAHSVTQFMDDEDMFASMEDLDAQLGGSVEEGEDVEGEDVEGEEVEGEEVEGEEAAEEDDAAATKDEL